MKEEKKTDWNFSKQTVTTKFNANRNIEEFEEKKTKV